MLNMKTIMDITGIIGGIAGSGSVKNASKPRRTRSDCTVGTFEKKHGLPSGTIRNRNGRDTRSDKRIGTIRKENKYH